MEAVKKILLIDDEPDFVDAFSRTLTAKAYQVSTASNLELQEKMKDERIKAGRFESEIGGFRVDCPHCDANKDQYVYRCSPHAFNPFRLTSSFLFSRRMSSRVR